MNGDNRQTHDYTEHIVASDELKDETAAALFQTPINTPEDALQLLLKASDLELQNTLHQGNPQSKRDAKSRKGSDTYQFSRGPPTESVVEQGQSAIIDPEIVRGGLNNGSSTEFSPETLGIWSRLRFVRAGWLTAREAVAYVNQWVIYHYSLRMSWLRLKYADTSLVFMTSCLLLLRSAYPTFVHPPSMKLSSMKSQYWL